MEDGEKYALIFKIIIFGCLLLVAPWLLIIAVILSLSLK